MPGEKPVVPDSLLWFDVFIRYEPIKRVSDRIVDVADLVTQFGDRFFTRVVMVELAHLHHRRIYSRLFASNFAKAIADPADEVGEAVTKLAFGSAALHCFGHPVPKLKVRHVLASHNVPLARLAILNCRYNSRCDVTNVDHRTASAGHKENKVVVNQQHHLAGRRLPIMRPDQETRIDDDAIQSPTRRRY